MAQWVAAQFRSSTLSKYSVDIACDKSFRNLDPKHRLTQIKPILLLLFLTAFNIIGQAGSSGTYATCYLSLI